MSNEEQHRREAIEHLSELVGEIPVAMLTTCGSDHTLHSRPMVNVNTNFQGELWFFTHADDPKVEEIRGNPKVNVAFASPEQKHYVSVSGEGTIVKDAKRCELLWTAACDPWFPEGPQDDNLALIKIEVDEAEYWDEKKNAMVTVAGMFRQLAGSKSGKSVEHDKLDWDPSEGPPGKDAAS